MVLYKMKVCLLFYSPRFRCTNGYVKIIRIYCYVGNDSVGTLTHTDVFVLLIGLKICIQEVLSTVFKFFKFYDNNGQYLHSAHIYTAMCASHNLYYTWF